MIRDGCCATLTAIDRLNLIIVCLDATNRNGLCERCISDILGYYN